MLRKLLLGTALGTFAAIGSANAKLIDSFDAPTDFGPGGSNTVNLSCNTTVALSCPVSGFSDYNAIPGGIIGGARRIDGTVLNAGGPGFVSMTVGVSNAGRFSHSQSDGTVGQSSVTWGTGTLNGALAGSNRDLTDGGASNMFHLVVTRADLGLQWNLFLTDSSGDTASLDFSSPANINAPVDFFLSFGAFTAGATFSFADVTQIIFSANQGAAVNADTGVDLMETVPEPMTMTMLGMGLAGLGLVARRRRKVA